MEKRQIDDNLFHDVVMAEEQSQSAGYQEGLVAGKTAGIIEGNKLGWEKGAAIGSEVGFYSGFTKTLLKEMEKDPTFKPRAHKPLTKLLQLIDNYCLSDPQNPELQTGLEEIRAKFKQVTSVLGIRPEPSGGSGKASKGKDRAFSLDNDAGPDETKPAPENKGIHMETQRQLARKETWPVCIPVVPCLVHWIRAWFPKT